MGEYLKAAALTAKQQLALQKEVGKQNKLEMEYNAKEAATARDWQKMMSDTSHQREVADLRAAGLNPVLSANGGAQSYTTSSASANLENASSSMAGVYSSALGAQATENAANANAAAMRKASALSAAAQRYAANRQAAAQEYAAFMNWKTKKDEYGWKSDFDSLQTKNKIKAANEVPATTLFGFIDKFLNNSGANKGVYGLIQNGNTRILRKKIGNSVLNITDHPTSVFQTGQLLGKAVTEKYFNNALTPKGRQQFNHICDLLHIGKTGSNRYAVFMSFFYGKYAYQRVLSQEMTIANKSASARRNAKFIDAHR